MQLKENPLKQVKFTEEQFVVYQEEIKCLAAKARAITSDRVVGI